MRRWPLLGNRDFMLLWGGEVVSELGSQASTVAYPLLVLSLTGSAKQAGIVGLAKWLPLAVFAVPAGVLKLNPASATLLRAHQEVERAIGDLEGGLGLEEISSLMGVAHETTKSRLRYALAKIREKFSE